MTTEPIRATAERLLALATACSVTHKWPFEHYVEGEALELYEPSESSLYAAASPQTITRLAKALIAALDCVEDRTPGFIECCPACGEPRFYENGDKGSDGGCAAGFDDGISTTLIKCPIRKPPTAPGETGNE